MPKKALAGIASDSVDSFPIVGIGASAGGLEAFKELLENLPASVGMAYVLVTHLDPRHESLLAKVLSHSSKMPVVQVDGDTRVLPDHVYVMPPNAAMVIADRTLRLHPITDEQTHRRRPIDVFFQSLAASERSRAIGIVLSGAASDGTLGLKAINAEGGITFAQDASAKFDSMPQSAIGTGIVDYVLSPKLIARELITIARRPQPVPDPEHMLEDSCALEKTLEILRHRTRVDFSLYRSTTIRRRLLHRMAIKKFVALEDYVARLESDPAEIDDLFNDLLIKVTGFFRDEATFEALKRSAFPLLFTDRSRDEPLRVWVPGCSTGEEIYSIGISLLEFLEEAGLSFRVLMFGTDASERVIETARAGVYDDSIESVVSAGRLQRFFTRSGSHYRINREVRELCVFSTQNLAADPPLSRMDLISCRNLLIYFSSVLQKRVIGTLAYALRPTGVFLVGTAENSSLLTEWFVPLDNEHRIYRKKSSLGFRPIAAATNLAGSYEPKLPRLNIQQAGSGTVHSSLNRLLISRNGPGGMLVGKDFRIIEIRGDMEKYLSPGAGITNLNLLEIVGPDLAAHLRNAVLEAHEKGVTVRLDEVEIRRDKAFNCVRITVIPVSVLWAEPHSVVLFEGIADPDENALSPTSPRLPQREAGPRSLENQEQQIEHLERQLASSHEYLQSIIEELQSANEEAQTSNEELQSSNEELQTTKEELQASNEELVAVNEALNQRNAQLGQLNDDLGNLVRSIGTAVVIVSRELNIRRFTPSAARLLHLDPADIDRPVFGITSRIAIPGLDETLHNVLEEAKVHEQEVVDLAGCAFLLSVQPYWTAEHSIAGAVLAFTDITHLKCTMEEVSLARDYANAIVDTVREPLLVLNENLTVRGVNRAFHQYFLSDSDQVEGRHLYEIISGQLDIQPIRRLLSHLSDGGDPLQEVEFECEFDLLGSRSIVLNARRVTGDGAESILLAFEDVTVRKRAAEARYRRLFESARDGIIILDAETGCILDMNPATERLLGYSGQELIGLKLWECAPTRATPGLQAAVEQIRDQNVVRFEEINLKTKDGRQIQAEVVGNVYQEGDRQAIQLDFRDLTERRNFDRELQHTQKLESLGLLAGGVAHDFNNLLTGIMGNASLLYGDLPDTHPFRVRLRNIITAAERAADLTRQLLAYAGKGKLVIEPISLSTMINEIFVLLQISIPKSVEIKLDLAPGLPPVLGDAAQMQQVIMNLLINAAEAIGEGKPGTVELRTSVRKLAPNETRKSFKADALTPGDYVVLEVKDTGSGMDEATKARIFDPFFTTKFTGRGLGLAAVAGVVKSLRGAIRVYSTPGLGTSFYILLPASGAPLVEPSPRPPTLVRASGTVLLVDDEESVRQVAREMLEKIGFDVLVAADGQAAVDIFREHEKHIILVVMDLTMPVMDGAQGFEAIRSIRAHVPILLASGYEDIEAAARTAGKDFAGFIHKPFNMERLAEAVGAALGLKSQT